MCALRKRDCKKVFVVRALLAEVEEIDLPYKNPRVFDVPHRVNALAGDAGGLVEALAADGIGCRRFFYPVHKQPAFVLPRSFPVAERLFERGISFPSSPLLTDEQIAIVCERTKPHLTQ